MVRSSEIKRFSSFFVTSCLFSGLARNLAEAELEADDAARSVELLVGASGASSSYLVGVRFEGNPERSHEGWNASSILRIEFAAFT